MLTVQASAYRAEYGFNAINLILANLYGPRDNADPATSHVIPALIRKCLEARRARAPEIEVWGSGTATREFLFVEDGAEAVCLAAERHDEPDPINVGSGSEVSIKELVGLVKDATGYTGGVRWDTSKPDGQPRRSLDTSGAARAFGFTATTPLATGLARTVEWYRARL
jgi:GDP-L-fucose synthase